MSVWKACDIRGLFPDEVSPTLLRRVARHLASWLPRGAPVLVAGDFRLSTPLLKRAVVDGLLCGGGRVLDAGQVPTPVAYFAHQHQQTAAVLIVTASHNPPAYNGLKFMVGGLPPAEEDLERLRAEVQCETSEETGAGCIGPGTAAEPVDAAPAYREWIEGRWEHLRGSGMRVVLDAGNGAWSELAPAIFEKLGFDVRRLFCEIDGRFPNRPPDCARSAGLSALAEAVKKEGAHLGLAWDGDGDRVAFCDETGQLVSADKLSVLLVRSLFRGRAGERVVYDIKLSDVVRRTIEEHGCLPIMERSGHTFLKRRMILDDCLLGCEVSGHYFYRELGGGDDALFTALLVADLVRVCGPLARQLASVPVMYLTPDLRLPTRFVDYEAIVTRLRGALAPIGETNVDGVRLETPDGFVLVRRSVTEPVVTLRIEGRSQAGLRTMVRACMQAFPELAHEIDEQIYQAEAV